MIRTRISGGTRSPTAHEALIQNPKSENTVESEPPTT